MGLIFGLEPAMAATGKVSEAANKTAATAGLLFIGVLLDDSLGDTLQIASVKCAMRAGVVVLRDGGPAAARRYARALCNNVLNAGTRT